MNTRIFHLHALSALHVGTGQGIGAVDLPIARSRTTNLPLVPGSALKGVLRDEAKEKWHLNQDDIQALFGADSQADKENIHASAAAFAMHIYCCFRSAHSQEPSPLPLAHLSCNAMRAMYAGCSRKAPKYPF